MVRDAVSPMCYSLPSTRRHDGAFEGPSNDGREWLRLRAHRQMGVAATVSTPSIGVVECQVNPSPPEVGADRKTVWQRKLCKVSIIHGHLAPNSAPISPCVICSNAATISRHGAVGRENRGPSIPEQRSSRKPQRSMATGPRPHHHSNGIGPSSWPRNQPSPRDETISPSPRPCSSGRYAPSRNAKRDG